MGELRLRNHTDERLTVARYNKTVTREHDLLAANRPSIAKVA
jgi:hypothetical protein